MDRQAYSQIAPGNYRAQADVEKTAPPKSTESENIIGRMETLQNIFADCRGMAAAAAEKILGPAPANAVEGIPTPGPGGFMASLDRRIGEMERIGSDLREELGRLNRAF